MASKEGDEVLQIMDPNDSDFSSFDPVEILVENVPVQKEKKLLKIAGPRRLKLVLKQKTVRK